jgi:hypothetical protein
VISSKETMYALVDFDNVPDAVTRKGPRYVADRVWSSLEKIDSRLASDTGRLDVRFYGGWLGKSSLTPRGSALIADVQRDFPFVIRSIMPITIGGELAQSLLLLPKHPLPYTFRRRHGGQKIDCLHPSKLGCVMAECPVVTVHEFLRDGACPVSTCERSAEPFLTKSEQKMVDTMLIADLIYLATTGENRIAVVSSDDDLWPGILTAMSMGTTILHVCTKYESTYKQYHGMIFGRYRFGRL